MARPAANEGRLQSVAPVLAQTLGRLGLGRLVLLGRLVEHWEEIVGPQIAAVTTPERLRGRVLFVTVNDAIWLQQLTFYQAQLLRKMHQVLGDVPIAKLHFSLAHASSAPVCTGAVEQTAPSPLSPEEERQILEGTMDIDDAELREVVRQTWRKDWQVHKHRACKGKEERP